jgi:hypothetical protein
VADQLALALDSTAPGIYRQRGTSSLQRLFRAHLPELIGRYDAEFAARLGKYRRERITTAVERFLDQDRLLQISSPDEDHSPTDCRGEARRLHGRIRERSSPLW